MSTTIWVVIGTAIGSVVAVAVLFFRSRSAGDDVPHYFRCPSCRIKIRYYARQIGHRGMCNNCKERFTFPSLSNP